MSNNKQSSVEWLAQVASEMGYISVEVLEQAKAMHKEEIEKAFIESRLTHPMIGFKHEKSEEYYNLTYGGNK